MLYFQSWKSDAGDHRDAHGAISKENFIKLLSSHISNVPQSIGSWYHAATCKTVKNKMKHASKKEINLLDVGQGVAVEQGPVVEQAHADTVELESRTVFLSNH